MIRLPEKLPAQEYPKVSKKKKKKSFLYENACSIVILFYTSQEQFWFGTERKSLDLLFVKYVPIMLK